MNSKIIKAGILLVSLLLVAVLVIGCTGGPNYGFNKTTGGGWFIDKTTGDKVTLGFTAQPTGVGTAKGEFQIVDHGTKTNLHGTFTTTSTGAGDAGYTTFAGTCRIDGVDSDFTVWFFDGGQGKTGIGDQIGIQVGSFYGNGVLQGGNIQVHK
jgi:hypothetical protein